MIPRILHIIWVGNESLRPDNLIQSWAQHHPDWQVKLWGNADLTSQPWRMRPRFLELGERDCATLAGAMKWEILWKEGGVVVPADSLCLAPLDEAWLRTGLLAHWEQEQAFPGLIGCSVVGCEAGNPLVDHLIEQMLHDPELARLPPSEAVGAHRLTKACQDTRYDGLRVLPSHTFQPRHPDAPPYRGTDAVHALELFGGRLGLLNSLQGIDPEALRLQFQASMQAGSQSAPEGPLFSVVIPTFNRRDDVVQAVGSVLPQAMSDTEVLVIDDGSTDGTTQTLADLKDRRLRSIRQTNQGVAAARNTGIENAKGRFIVWLDSDDLLMPGTLDAYRRHLADANTQTDILFGNLQVRRPGQSVTEVWSYDQTLAQPLLPRLLNNNLLPNPGTAVRRALYERLGGYDTSLPASEDYDFWLRSAAHQVHFAHVAHIVAEYRIHAGSVSSDAHRNQQADAQLVHKALLSHPWATLFPSLDWTQAQQAQALALLQATAAQMKRQAWREVSELAASLQMNTATLAGDESGATKARLAPSPAAAPSSPTPTDARSQHQARRLQEVMQQYRVLAQQPSPRFALNWEDRWLCLDDNTSSTGFDRHYTLHPAWAARVLAQSRPARHVDFSSSLQFITQISAFVNTEFYDVRPVDLGLSGLRCGHADLTRLPFESNSLESVSCMHVVEHVGLARYGDELDYDGDLKAISELQRVTAHGGQMLFVVPIGGQARIQFNAHRIYTHTQVCDLFAGWQLKEFALIPDDPQDGQLIVNATRAQSDRQRYGCGCFWFVKS